jgi:hypothetical protein
MANLAKNNTVKIYTKGMFEGMTGTIVEQFSNYRFSVIIDQDSKKIPTVFSGYDLICI